MGTKISDLWQRGRYAGDPASSGNNTLVAAVTGKKIVVTSYFLQSNGTVNAKFQDGGSTQISGTHYEVANTGVCAGYNDEGWFETSAGNALTLNLSGNTAVGVTINYALVG